MFSDLSGKKSHLSYKQYILQNIALVHNSAIDMLPFHFNSGLKKY